MALTTRTQDKDTAAGTNGGVRGRERRLALIALGAILLLGGFLRFYRLGNYTIGNTYYAAMVKSMLTSWHDFFVAAFEPGGSVTVDKPPLGFWIQAISAYFLGVNGFALALPQALAGTLSIALLYCLVRRQFGPGPGLVAALVLAITPIAVATERNNTIDGLLVFTLLLAAWAFIMAAEKRRFRYLLVGAILVGLGFNIKMLQAFMPLPALFALYFLAARIPWWRRLLHLAAAAVVLLTVSLAWVIAVDLTPVGDRPYIGSSQNNTVLELVIGHNGLSRLGLGGYGPRRAGAGRNPQLIPARPGVPAKPSQPRSAPSQANPPLAQPPQEAVDACKDLAVGEACTIKLRDGNRIRGTCQCLRRTELVCVPRNRDGQNQPPGPQAGQAGTVLPPDPGAQPAAATGNQPRSGRAGETGTAGLLRLFEEPLVREASWLLPLALMGMPLGAVTLGWAWPLTNKHASLLLWAGWLLPEMVYFSFTTGLFHRYYLIMLGPPLAALAGLTAWALIQLWKRRPLWGWTVLLVLSGFTVAFQVFTLRQHPHTFGTVTAVATISWLLGMVLLLRRGTAVTRWAGIALVGTALLAAPLTLSVLTTSNTNPDVALPTAGADGMSATTFMIPNHELLGPVGEAILTHVQANTAPSSYLLATDTARDAAPFILATGSPVFTFGGFTGNDDVVDLDGLIEMVEDGDLRYVLGLPQQKPDIARWIQGHCAVVEVPGFASAARGGEEGQPLFDCRLKD